MDDLAWMICEQIMQKSCQTCPKYHHKVFLWLIAEKLFDTAAHTFVQSLADQMQGGLERTSQRNRKRRCV